MWSVFVANQPVESSINDSGKLLVPLIKSSSDNNQLKNFPVELIYALRGNRLSLTGSLSAGLPAVDLMTSEMIWSVYLPNDYAYLNFTSSLEKEEMIRGFHLLASNRREYNEDTMREVLRLADEDSGAPPARNGLACEPGWRRGIK